MSLKFENSLHHLSQSTDDLIESILNNDANKVSERLGRWRFVRSTLSVNFRKTLRQLEGEVPATKIRSYSDQLRLLNQKEEVIKQWLHRYDTSKTLKELLADDDGVEYLVDSMLPTTWDFKKDLIVLISDHASSLAKILKKKGQTNIFFFSRNGKQNIDGNVIEVSNLDELSRFIAVLFPIPQRALVLEPLDFVDDAECVSEFASNFEKVLERNMFNEKTAQGLATEWAIQKSKNLWALPNCYSIVELKVYIKDKPIVIALPGPSLKDDIERIKESRENIVLLAAAQACITLSEYGITADFIFIIDSADIYDTILDIDKRQLKGLVLYDTCHPKFFSDPSIKRFVIKNDHHIFDTNLIIENHRFDHSANGVAIVMFKICAFYQAKIIGLLGLDLSLSRGHYVGYKGAKSKRRTAQNNNLKDKPGFIWLDALGYFVEKEEVISNSGKKVITKKDYLLFLKYFEDIIKENSDIIPPVANFSKHGAKIEGAKYMIYKNFLHKFASKPLKDSAPIPPIANLKHRKNIVLETALQLNRSVEKVRSLSAKALKEIKQPKSTKLDGLKQRIVEEIEKEPALGFIVRADVDFFLDDLRISGYGEPDVKVGYDLYKAIRNKTLALKKGLTISINNLRMQDK